MIIHVRPVTLQGRNRRFRDKTPFRARILARSRSWRARKGCPGRQDAAECWLNCGTLDVCYASKSFTNIELHPLMLAFLLNSDVASWQAQMEARRSSYFREKVGGLFLNYFLKDWETLCVRAGSGNSHNHRRDRVCRSRFFRGNRIVKAMSVPGRSGRGGSRRLALWQRCCLDALSARGGHLSGNYRLLPA